MMVATRQAHGPPPETNQGFKKSLRASGFLETWYEERRTEYRSDFLKIRGGGAGGRVFGLNGRISLEAPAEGSVGATQWV